MACSKSCGVTDKFATFQSVARLRTEMIPVIGVNGGTRFRAVVDKGFATGDGCMITPCALRHPYSHACTHVYRYAYSRVKDKEGETIVGLV